jgi:hypothetical protein
MKVRFIIIILIIIFYSGCKKLNPIKVEQYYDAITIEITNINDKIINDTIYYDTSDNRLIITVGGTSSNTTQKVDNGTGNYKGYDDFIGNIYILVLIDESGKNGGWYIQGEPAIIDGSGNWEVTAYIGDTDNKPVDGGKIKLRAFCTDEIKTMECLIKKQDKKDHYEFTLESNLPQHYKSTQDVTCIIKYI